MTTEIADANAMTRREFLFYIWVASLVVFTGEVTGLIIWFAIPRFREGEFGGRFTILPDDIPEVNMPPVNNAAGRFWLVQVDSAQENELMYPAPDEGGPRNSENCMFRAANRAGVGQSAGSVYGRRLRRPDAAQSGCHSFDTGGPYDQRSGLGQVDGRFDRKGDPQCGAGP